MATVKPGEKRFSQAHYGLYKTRLGGDEAVVVRRQQGQPTDWMHEHSRAVALQRERFAVASKHYSHLTPTQKRWQRDQIGFVERQSSPSRVVVLSGRQLFISREMRHLLTQGLQLLLPYEVCIILTDIYHHPLMGQLQVFYQENGAWHEVHGAELATGHWLIINIPRGKEWYRVEGQAMWYIDPKLPDTQYMTAEALLAHRYHVLIDHAHLLLLEAWDFPAEPEWAELLLEAWGLPILDIPWLPLLEEAWTYLPDITWQPLLLEEWLCPDYTIEWLPSILDQWLSPEIAITWQTLMIEAWLGPAPQEGHRLRHFEMWRFPRTPRWTIRLAEPWNRP